MPVNINIVDTKFYNEFKNDPGFVSNLGDFTFNLAGSVCEKVKVIRQIDVSFNARSTQSDGFAVDTTLNQITRQGGGDFLDDGVAVGDTFDWYNYLAGPGVIWRGQVQSVSSKVIIYTVISGVPVASQTNGPGFRDAEMKFDTFLTALEYRFGIISNGDQYDNESLVSGNDQGYYGSNIGFDTGGGIRDTNFVTLQRLGQYEDWRTGTARARFMNNPDSPNKYIQRFEIEHEFTIVPWYLDGELTNLQNNVIPTLLNGNNSLKYVFEPEFRTVLSNPNTSKSKKFDSELGSVAWFNENFNGFNNNYQINSITYAEQPSGNNADGILSASKTRVTIQVEKLNGNFAAGERLGVYVSYLPNQNEYQNTVLTDLTENFLFDRALGNAGGSGFNGDDFISNLTVFSPVGNLITLFFDVEYSAAQKLRLANQAQQGPIYYLIGLENGDNTLTSGNSDRIINLVDVREYDDSPDIPNLAFVTKFDLYEHSKQIGVDLPATDMVGWNESGIVVDYNFQLNRNLDAFINTLEFKLVAFDPVSEQFFELDSSAFNNIGSAIVSSGIQQLNEQSTRGYILAAGDQFNDKTLNTGTLVAGLQNYFGRFAQKFKWQDWIANLGVDSIFYDVTKPNDNLNFKSSNYSLLNGYEIRMAVMMNLTGQSSLGVSGITDYLFLSPTLTVYDYEEDGNITPVWTHLIETFNASNNAPLGGAVLSGQDTLFRATWTNSGGPVTTLNNIFVINRIQETGSPGDDIDEMSSINLPPSGQRLIPKPTFTLLDVQIVGGLVVAECLIDGSTIAPGVNYDLSTEIRDTSLLGGKQKSPTGDLKQKGSSSTVKLVAP